MNSELVKEKLFEQIKVYQELKSGEYSQVQYVEQYDKVWGKSDRNYLNRMRLAYYLLYAQIDDENAVVSRLVEDLSRKMNREVTNESGTGKI